MHMGTGTELFSLPPDQQVCVRDPGFLNRNRDMGTGTKFFAASGHQ